MQSPENNPVLPNGHSPVAPGHVATIVTALEMNARPQPRSARPFPAGVELVSMGRPDIERYRALFRTVGTEWLWFSRLTMEDAKLQAILDDPKVEFFAVQREGRDAGLLELDFRQDGECELAYFGLVPELVGSGVGRTLMNEAIARAWARPIGRFWVHTCTLDHPGALDFYRRSGFVPYQLQVEVAPDPRLTGTLPRESARHVPLLG